MKSIINGKLYNTETATLVADESHNLSDFSYTRERLYRKKTGEYFLHGEGGPMSKYSRKDGNNSWTGGEKIVPLTRVEALKWAEENMTADDYIAEFGEVEE